MKNIILTVSLCLAATAAFAQSAKNKELEPFIGDWKCTGTAFASEMGPEHPLMATVHAKWILDGAWVEIDYAESKTAKNPHPVAVRIFMSYDAGLKKFVYGTVDNFGGYGTEESSGWNGDTMVFTGPSHMGAMTSTSRDTFMKAKNEIRHMGETEVKGAWKKTDEQTCRK